MKLVFRSLLLHLCCIVLFTYFYYFDSSNFDFPHHSKKDQLQPITWLDCFNLATTIQAGVGYASMYPANEVGKMLMIAQQFIMIASHVLTLYIFTL